MATPDCLAYSAFLPQAPGILVITVRENAVPRSGDRQLLVGAHLQPMKKSRKTNQTSVETGELMNVLGERGEKIAYLALTDYIGGSKPLIRPAFLGEKWPTVDYYAELEGDGKQTPVALFQVKTSGKGLDQKKKSLPIQLTKNDAERLARLPIPAYVIGVCETSRKVFVRAVEKKGKGMTTIPSKYKLTPSNLRALHREIVAHWKANTPKDQPSKFV
jgi:hypothetical protein